MFDSRFAGTRIVAKSESKRVAFVIDPDAGSVQRVVYVLTSAHKASGRWHVSKVDIHGDKDVKRSVREYAQGMFLLLSHAMREAGDRATRRQAAGPQGGEDAGAIAINGTDRVYGYWVKRVFDVITKKTEYRSIRPELREGLESLLQVRGKRTKPPTTRVEVAEDCVARVFFWDIRKKPFASLDLDELAEKKTLLRLDPHPAGDFEPAETLALSQEIRKSLSVETWQDLYARNAIDYNFMPSARWLNIASLEVTESELQSSDPQQKAKILRRRLPALRFQGPPSEVAEIVQRHTNVLFTGPAGSGKSTSLRQLATWWICTERPSDKQGLSFYICLKDTEVFLDEQLQRHRGVDMAELVGEVAVDMIRRRCAHADLEECEVLRRIMRKRGTQQERAHVTRDGLLTKLCEEVVEWFREEGSQRDEVILLVDGINELRPRLQDLVVGAIKELLGKPCRVVASCRSNLADRLFSSIGPQLTRFELQQLDDQQIISYLEHKIEGQGERIFQSQIRVYPRILTMARNPFYLNLICEHLGTAPNAKIPAERARLIEDFISRCIDRKHAEGLRPEEYLGLKEDMMYVVLPGVAKWSIDVLTLKENQHFAAFQDSREFRELTSRSEEVNTLGISEVYGVLECSGLLDESRWRRGYPTFLHDNIRDFFAALYLRSLDQAQLINHLPEMAEYFAWDQPLLFFLELAADKSLSKKIIEFFLPVDPIMAGACARHAQVVDKAFLLSVVKQISHSPFGQGVDRSLRARAQSTICSDVSWPSMYALERLSIAELIEIALDTVQDSEVRECARGAIPGNSGPDDLPALKEFWVKLYKTPDMELGVPLLAVRNIPTAEAFEFLVEVYSQLRSLPQYDRLSENRIYYRLTFRPDSIGYTAYSPPFAEVLERFPPDKYPDECGALLERVSNVTTKEINLVEELVFGDNLEMARTASGLLARTLGDKALPTLLKAS